MAPESIHQSPQPLTFNILDEIEGDYCHDEVLVRLIHYWEARNFKKADILLDLELLLIDSQVNREDIRFKVDGWSVFLSSRRCIYIYKGCNVHIYPQHASWSMPFQGLSL